MISKFSVSTFLRKTIATGLNKTWKIFALFLTIGLVTCPAVAQVAEDGSPTNAVSQGSAPNLLPAPAPVEAGPDINPSNPFSVPQLTLKPSTAYSAYQRGFYLTAFDLATKLAGLGEVSAQTLLGELLYRGQGIPKDSKKAAEWWALSAEQGDKEAQFALGLLHATGDGVQKDFPKALSLFEKAAEQGQKHAQFNLAILYLQGQIVQRDLTKAMHLFTKSAEQGLADAQYALANLYRSDFFPTPDYDQASYWMQQAAKGGLTDAQLELGLMLFNGNGMKQDYAMARTWIEQAANAGHVLAQNRLARILARGFGASPEPIEAAKYYLLARRAGKRDDWLEAFFQKLSNDDKNKALKAVSQHALW